MAGISFPLSALLQSSKPWGLTEVPLPAMSSNTRKRPAPPPPQKPSPAAQTPKHHAASQEDEFVDEDVYLDETETLILEDEEILRDIEDRRTVACRLAKWTRPPLSDAYVSQSRSVGESISTRSGVLHFHSARVSAKNLNFFVVVVSLSFSAIRDWLCHRRDSQSIVAQLVWLRRHYQNFRSYKWRLAHIFFIFGKRTVNFTEFSKIDCSFIAILKKKSLFFED